MFVIGSRERSQPAPPPIIWCSLTQPRDPSARPWLELLDDEIEPRIIEAVDPTLVVWSSLWPSRPDDLIRFELRAAGGGTALRWTMTTEAEPPDESKTGHLRHRLNYLINGGLQRSFGQ